MIGAMAPPRPSYLLTDIPPHLRLTLSVVAALEDRSLSNLVLSVLCTHYGLETPKGRRYVQWLDRGSDRMVIRANPELFDAVKREAAVKEESMKKVILDVLSEQLLTSLGT